jgi:hypothetical protein
MPESNMLPLFIVCALCIGALCGLAYLRIPREQLKKSAPRGVVFGIVLFVACALLIGALGGCQTQPVAVTTDAPARMEAEEVRREPDFAARQDAQAPRVGRVGRLSFVDVAPGDYGYYNVKRYSQLLMAVDSAGARQMIDAGDIVEIPSCRFRVIEVVGNRNDAYAHLLCEVRLEDCALEGQSAWMYFGPTERGSTKWEF